MLSLVVLYRNLTAAQKQNEYITEALQELNVEQGNLEVRKFRVDSNF